MVYHIIWVITIIIASTLVDLSETEHGLNGVYPFNKYSYQFLWFDSIMAITPVTYHTKK